MKKIKCFLVVAMILVLTACSDDTENKKNYDSNNVKSEAENEEGKMDSEELENTDNVDSEQKEVEILPIEVKEFGYSMNNEYLYYSVIIHNPNKDKAVEFPEFRITARNESGEILGTEEQTLSIIYPQQDFVFAGMAFESGEVPAKVEVEVLEPDDYNIMDISTMDNSEYIPLKTVNTTIRGDRFVGEVQNDNDFALDSAVVVVIFRDENGKLIGGDYVFVDSVKANSSVPFDEWMYVDFVTDNYEVYAYIW